MSRRTRSEATAASAHKVLADRRYDRLRTPGARIAIAVGAIAVIVLVPPAFAVSSTLGLGLVCATFAAWVLLRLAVRTIADLPDDFLDERQRTVRDAAYREAYTWFAGLAVLLATAGLIAFTVRSTDDALTITLSWDAVFPWAWVVIAASMCLPSIVLALRDRELSD